MSIAKIKKITNITEKIVKKIVASRPTNELGLMRANRSACRKFKLAPLPKRIIAQTYDELIKQKKLKPDACLSQLLKVRAVRTLSGVAPVTVLTKPYTCPGQCIYCPHEPGMPKSYLSNEPAAQRAKALHFDPYQQVAYRLKALIANGHSPEKIELLVLGATWSAYPWAYRQWFIKRCFEAANQFAVSLGFKTQANIAKTNPKTNLQAAQKKNEKTKYRIIGITLETRPDFVTPEEIKRLRILGCTRVQLGAQILDDKILARVKRGHTVADLARATAMLRDAGFKIDYHLMPNLPGATPAKDLKTMRQVFADKRFQPDQIKIYPTIVNEYAPLYKLYRQGKYKSYSPKKLVELIIELKKAVPYYCRINRLIRDIPRKSIAAGNKVTNLRQMLGTELKKRGVTCKCIRCREVRTSPFPVSPPLIRGGARGGAKLFTQKYSTSSGTEYFISYESPKRDILYAFVRLRLPNNNDNAIFPELTNAGLIRELHTYGQLQTVGAKSQAVQHQGLGKKLMAEAEAIARQHGYKKIAVIAGIGVRDYYRKLGYKLESTYMIKKIKA
ncbi:tRNA uridine(34) 5-carboxymethylaminomethyl modification radical SAM/GNAT enzyme Elp3 [Candidatus Falkowbacteria bacterium CG10_big_fil_rev_8_21_14_0_10_43_11]|uniref:tRNA carboxymethyluridine synthase n=1 Tax=Candidatus Falkowbacteria bacterium CG10_big_fil_rev_8_21_14_0_10_43_11 TaxID=1974568 RepID=A0A2M6WMA5_9BACT|nr:MAG: tRNA uridine(34) 5-carboxymethylaminomethyl modification radical SAM/GNAT enzyme Elp3 [Candidatus Falkowbacteria bacterium CG10_big_fil_rev_8_21_14_0_10_43_11]